MVRIILAALFCFWSLWSLAITYTFTGAAAPNRAWNNAGNWDVNGVAPDSLPSGDIININSSLNFNTGISFTILKIYGTINIAADVSNPKGVSFWLYGDDGDGILNISSGSVSVTNLLMFNGGSVDITSGATFTTTSTSNVQLDGSFNNGGTFSPTGSIVNGDCTFTNELTGVVNAVSNWTNGGGTITNINTVNLGGNYTGSGTFTSTANTSEINLNGSSTQSISSITAFSVIVNNSNNINLTGNLNISTGGNLSFTSGNINTSTNLVSLSGTSTISGETSSHYVIGQLRATTTSTSSTFGGSGVSLTLTGGSGGTITMNRFTGTATAGNGNTGLQRWVDIDATAAGYTTSTLVMSYFDTELGTIDPETSMKAFSTTAASNEIDNSATWTGVTEVVDPSANTITISGLTPVLLDGFSFTGGDDGQILPVSLSKFTAMANANAATLNWTTATEENNQGFEIQRSIDGNNFDVIAFVNGAGNSINDINYEYIDNAIAGLESNKIYYRLKQIDFNGEYSFSPTKVIDFSKAETQFKWFPNPATNQIVLETGNSTYTQIFDLTGRKLLDFENAGNPVIDITSLEMGSYIIRFLDAAGNLVMQDRLIKN